MLFVSPADRNLRAFAMFACWLSIILLTGCGNKPQIREYDIPLETPDRMFGAIVLREKAGWFFKVTGPKEEIDAAEPQMREFLASLKFSEEDSTPPKWTLPEGWTLDPQQRELRVATILVPLKSGDKELTVTVLPQTPDTSPEQYLLTNINRWRGQLGRHKLQAEELAVAAEKLTIDSSDAWIVKVAGKAKPAGPGGAMGPFSGS